VAVDIVAVDIDGVPQGVTWGSVAAASQIRWVSSRCSALRWSFLPGDALGAE
jgi:hypothetical protein